MLQRVLLLAAAACARGAATTNATNARQPWKLRNATNQPWKLRNAKRGNMSHWTGLDVALLYRGMHYGSYKSERHGGKFVRVNANHPTVIKNRFPWVLNSDKVFKASFIDFGLALYASLIIVIP